MAQLDDITHQLIANGIRFYCVAFFSEHIRSIERFIGFKGIGTRSAALQRNSCFIICAECQRDRLIRGEKDVQRIECHGVAIPNMNCCAKMPVDPSRADRCRVPRFHRHCLDVGRVAGIHNVSGVSRIKIGFFIRGYNIMRIVFYKIYISGGTFVSGFQESNRFCQCLDRFSAGAIVAVAAIGAVQVNGITRCHFIQCKNSQHAHRQKSHQHQRGQ